ncbi:MAG: hypothetical protein KC425_20055, partial [Anaerolineales bacterium]|nr:hypothetical protein [Anaerolineales bacterium]
QRALLAEYAAVGEADGFVHEEIAECLLALGDAAAARPHFAAAHRLLAPLGWVEADRLARLAALAAEDAA